MMTKSKCLHHVSNGCLHHVSNWNPPLSHFQSPPEVRSGPEGPKQAQQVQADSQTTWRPPRPNFRTTANNTCPDDVMFSRVSYTCLKTYSVLNHLLLHLSPPSQKPYTSCPHYSPVVSIETPQNLTPHLPLKVTLFQNHKIFVILLNTEQEMQKT